jgi:hypothetical protein
MATAQPLDVLRQALERYLVESFGDYEQDADGDYVVRRGSAVVYVRPLEWQQGQTLVRIWSVTNIGVRVDGELTRFLATENRSFVFGGFALDESGPAVIFGHTLLGDFLSREEVAQAVAAVAETADEYDDRIRARFGGRLPSQPGSALQRFLSKFMPRDGGA